MIKYASFTLNRSPRKGLDRMTPYEAYHRYKLNRRYTFLAPTVTFVYQRKKLSGIWCGFERESKTYKWARICKPPILHFTRCAMLRKSFQPQ